MIISRSLATLTDLLRKLAGFPVEAPEEFLELAQIPGLLELLGVGDGLGSSHTMD